MFKRKAGESSKKRIVEPSIEPSVQTTHTENRQTTIGETSYETICEPFIGSSSEQRPRKILRSQSTPSGSNYLERDPGKRKQIYEYPSDQRNDIRRAYNAKGAYQPPVNNEGKSGRQFQSVWYIKYPKWLEYSPEKDAAFCLYCFLFNKPNGHPAYRAFTIDGFRNWKKVGGKQCAFLMHIGKDHNSPHAIAKKELEDLLNQKGHVPQMYSEYTPKQIAENRLIVKCSVMALHWLALQGLAMRGRDESEQSSNRGNFLELVKHQAKLNLEMEKVVLKNAPGNATYTSPDIQKEILYIISEKTKAAICEEIGEEKFCITVDEAGDVSRKQQMAIILRFVNQLGLVQERFFCVIHVPNTAAQTLKNEILSALSCYNFDVKNLRGQGYDGASNMRGRWSGLQALISKDCPFAYYVHCFAHRLQLALVAAAKEVTPIYQFFTKLSFVINIILASNKRTDELKVAHSDEISMLVEEEELETGIGLNQASNLQRPGDTRWSSHLISISSVIKMFSATCSVLYKLEVEGGSSSERAEATTAIDTMASFDFVFILHLMKNILELSDMLSQALQGKSQEILNSLHLVESTKTLLQKLRDEGWDPLLAEATFFCERRNIEVPNLSSIYKERGGRARHQQGTFTVIQHYKVNIFYAAIDVQLQELNVRFNEKSVELLTLSCALEPRGGGKYFCIDNICDLVNKFYPEDFTDVEKEELRVQLCHYEVELSRHQGLKNFSTISDLSQWLVNTGKKDIYRLLFRLVKLVLTLPVSAASAERAFSAMNIVKTTLRNKMDDEFFESCMVIKIERDIANNFSVDSIIDAFRDLKECRL